MNNHSFTRFLIPTLALVAITACTRVETRTVFRDEPVGSIERPPVETTESPAVDRSIFPELGKTSFLSANNNELLSAGTSNPYSGRNSQDALAGTASFDDDSSEAAPTDPEPMPDPDPTREIVEADLYKVEGNFVYVLNRYRGLVIIDLSVPDAPVVRGRLPFQAIPIEMYVRDGRAYIVMSDYFVYWMYDPDADPLGFHGSQILIVDVADVDNPTRLGSLPVEGEITDTRMVGDVLYAVSKRRPDFWRYNTADWEDTTWVVSLNLADPANIHEVDRVTFRGTSTLIHAAQHAIFVAATDPNYYLYDPEHVQETLVTYVDISDPNGDIEKRGHVYVPGWIADKFKMDYFDATFRVFTQRSYYASDHDLIVVDVSFPDQMEIVGQLSIEESSWGYLRATRFSNERAYAMTHRWTGNTAIQELHVIDLALPHSPAHAATILVDGDINHFEVHDDNTRLLAVGRSSDYYDYRTQLTLFDVSTASAPSELSRIRLGEGYSYSQANYDYKALKVLRGMNLILLPLSFSDYGSSQYFNGTQLVDWVGDSLIERGRVTSIDRVQRVFPVGDRIFAISTKQLQVINATDRDMPVVTAALNLIRNVFDVFEIQGRQIQLVGDVYQGGLSFYVIPFGPDDDVEPLASLDLPFSGVPFCFQRGDVIHMIGWEPNRAQVIRTADFSQVLQPRLRGDLELTGDVERIYSTGYGFYYYHWNPNAGLPLENKLLPFTVREIIEDETGRRDFTSDLRLIDVSDLDNPRIADGSVPMNEYPFINKVTHGNVLHSTHVEQATTDTGNSLLYHVRSYLDRIDVSDPDSPVELPSINVPGWLVDVSDDGQIVYTIDYQWDDFGRRRNSINTLRIVGNEAILVDVLPVSDQVNRALFRDRTIWLTTHKYPWWGVHSDTVESRQPYTVINKINVLDSGLVGAISEARIHGYHFDLMDMQGDLAYLGSRYPYGVLVLDVQDPTDPLIVASTRTIGYISRIVLHEGEMYTPLGMFGVHQMFAD